MPLDQEPDSPARRLWRRRGEIEKAVFESISKVADPAAQIDPRYRDSLRRSVSSAIDFALEVLEQPGNRNPNLPRELLSQARFAARLEVPLDIVLRRYVAGYLVFARYVLLESSPQDDSIAVKQSNLERLLSAVAEEYNREASAGRTVTARDGLRLVDRLLAGELPDTANLQYDLGGWHIGMVLGGGPNRGAALGHLATALSCRLLVVEREDGTLWAWLGGDHRLRSSVADARISDHISAGPVAIGEPLLGLDGWRLTHRQARAIYGEADKMGEGLVRYADRGLLSAVSENSLLAESLRRLYVVPLSQGADGGKAMRDTIRAYLASGRNITSAAAALKLNRQTVRSRLREAEERIGRSMDECGAEIEVALRLPHCSGE